MMVLCQAVIETLEKKNFKRWMNKDYSIRRLYYNGTTDKAYYDLVSGEYVCDNPQTIEKMKALIEQEYNKHQEMMRREQMEHDLKDREEKLAVEFADYLNDFLPGADYSNFIKAGIFYESSYWTWRIWYAEDIYKKAKDLWLEFDKKAIDDANASGQFRYHVTYLDYQNSGKVAQTYLEICDQYGYENKLAEIMRELGYNEEEIKHHLYWEMNWMRCRIKTVNAFGRPERELDFGQWEEIK